MTQPALLISPPPAQAAPATPCPICGESRRRYLFVVRGLPIARCPGCGLVLLHPAPDTTDVHGFYAGMLGQRDARHIFSDSKTESEAARRYRHLLAARGVTSGRLLVIAPRQHPFVVQARAKGYEIGWEGSIDEFEQHAPEDGGFDAAVVLYQLEKATSPGSVLAQVRALLVDGGLLLLALPSTDSWPARFFGADWTEWRPENRFYFDSSTAHLLLLRHGFERTWLEPDRRIYTLSHIYDRARAFPGTWLTRAVRLAYRLTLPPLRRLRLRLATSGVVVTAQAGTVRARPLCSVVLPAYNEAQTFPVVMDALLAKDLRGADMEIVVVESNSRDGTREAAQRYANRPGVRLVLEDRPRGKGHAVRTGLRHARGDIVLIQDADLEYDLNDYDDLLEPLLGQRALFVLGARHGGAWKMRHFTDQRTVGRLMNFGHVLFTWLVNVLYGQRMRDPFTMYKVVRRDCLYGLQFECNRFDFDHELVIKLVKKGYRPLELPVNYRSRSFRDGKKVRFFRDPLTWLWVDFKHVFTPLRREES